MKLFWGSPTFEVSAPFSTIYAGYALARSKSTTSCCSECLPPLWITIRRTSSRLFRCVVLLSACTCLLSNQSDLISPFFFFGVGATFAVHLLCEVGFVIGNPSGSSLEILGRKPLWKNGDSSVMSILMNRSPIDDPVFQSTYYSDCILGTTRISKQCDPVPCETTIPRDQPHIGNDWRHPLRSWPRCNFIHPQQLSPSPNAWNCPFPTMISCQATWILSPQDRIALLCGVR